MALDPVCGMEVDEDTAVAKSEYKGKTYFFCTLACKNDFDENPEVFVESFEGLDDVVWEMNDDTDKFDIAS